MHPALSVILFTSLSGAGYGLWFWLAVALLATPERSVSFAPHAAGLALGLVLVTTGLLSSLAHLGQPQRAWRAFSQWRSSWLSREGVLALACYPPALLALAWLLFDLDLPLVLRTALLLALALGALATVACTAMIYASLRPIPAWRHPLVLPGYLLFAVFSGGLLAAALLATPLRPLLPGWVLLAGALAGALALLKSRYWQALDGGDGMPSRASAVGLPAGSQVRPWEAPHTEANYLNREMGYVLARRHRHSLRALALALFGVVPCLLTLVALLLPTWQRPVFALAAVSALAGAMVERWLFFAEARHVVNVYYR
jgi:DMSO reductase anchor subunit